MQKNVYIVIKTYFNVDYMATEIVHVFSDYIDAEKYINDNKSDDLIIETWLVDFKD